MHDEDVKVMVPTRVMQERRKGAWKECEKLLLPGYVFVYVSDSEDDELQDAQKVDGRNNLNVSRCFENYFKIDDTNLSKNRTRQKIKFDYIKRLLDVCKFLDYHAGVRELLGSDFNYADWILRYNGRIGQSIILQEGERIKVLEGPLKDCEGRIIKLDKRKKRAWVEFTFDGQKRRVSLMVDNVVE